MNSSSDLSTIRPSLPPPSAHHGGGWTMDGNVWMFIALIVAVIALLAVILLTRFLLTRMHGADSTDAVADFEQGKVTRGPVIDMRDKVHVQLPPRESYEEREIGSPSSLPTPPPTAATSPSHTIAPPEVIVTPPTPIPGEEERTKKRTYSLDDY
ncbi:hypothetical protein PRIPAC_97059 [Pristionchus pacificus]|uniref:Uncharacterized protein n=1 Tax=Pristionchus pacificus TaxID=54126 RepID=A0A2A6BCL9_PRIPA|nr:hypothetical protein PRIPAC_97059 [Pristionchus pacificus]|eukprot:PDM63614.1 hypothetical protein PRIPAC_49587 [Pristionchus pacificus]